jgi:hypothetical protein
MYICVRQASSGCQSQEIHVHVYLNVYKQILVLSIVGVLDNVTVSF